MGARGWQVPAARALGFLLPAICAADYTASRFYRSGAAVWDSGWFAWLATHATAWPMPNPPAIGGDYLAVHFAPIFFLLTAAHGLLPFLPAPVWFALTQGLWFGLLGLACALCAETLLPGRPWAAAALALPAAGNGIALATLGFPHVEIAWPALLFLAIALRGRTRWWWLALLLMLTVREDAGLHAALAFTALALLRAHAGREWRAALPEARIAALCLAASLAAILLQRLALGGGQALSGTYLGTPPLAHLTGALALERLQLLFRHRAYLWAPLLLLLLLAAARRDPRPLAGALIGLPWIAFSFIARSDQAALMWDYYALPLMASLCWPLLAGHALPPGHRRDALAQAAIAVLSIALFTVSGRNHDHAPWRGFSPAVWARVAPAERAIDWLLAHRPALGRLAVGDAVAALRPGAFTARELRYGLAYTPAETRAIDTLAEWPGGWLASRKADIRRIAGLTHRLVLPGSTIVIHSRLPLPAR